MTARTHDMAAITALVLVFLADPPERIRLSTLLLTILANQIGGIAPDIDQPTAPFWRNLPVAGLFGRTIAKLLGGHRFLSHSLLGLVLFGFLVNLLLHFAHPLMPKVDIGYVWYGFMIGMVSHLVMDSFTKEGVPWLLPLPFKLGFPPIKHFRVTTGKKVEALLVFPLLTAIAIWLCAINYNELTAFMQTHLIR